MKEGGWCLLSCFSEIYVIAPFGWILTPGHVHHGLEVNSLEFQWSCWPCLLVFFGETKLQICNLIQLCYCNSASSPSIYFLFFPHTLNYSFSESLNYGELSNLAHLDSLKIGCCLLFWSWACFLFSAASGKRVKHACSLDYEFPS